MPNSFEPHFPLQLESGTTSLQNMNDSDVPPPLPLAKAQIHHDRLHEILMQQRAMVQGTELALQEAADMVNFMQDPANARTTNPDFLKDSARLPTHHN